ncbi:hypothetical protein ACIP6Q_39215 [Streptomyces bobili]|uniref:hypothetical protein n=1 Tax=Streptomyces bobili TaxID=67280 RepID=UPI0037FBDC71
MKVRSDVAELLKAGLSNRAIARELHVDAKDVSAARIVLGLPKAKSGKRPASTPEDLFWHRAQPTDDGHMQWTGYHTKDGVPGLRHRGTFYTANRLAYRMATGRDPEGYALPSCGRDHCVKPGHHTDRVDREREKRVDSLYGAIFGQSA